MKIKLKRWLRIMSPNISEGSKGMADLKSRVKNLKFEFKPVPQKELLIAMPNPCPGRDYEEEISYNEFTSLCPLNPHQPDFARLIIRYTPAESIIELKSLKFYLTSYRTVETFFEEATNRVLDDLAAAVRPKKMDIIAEWNIRGGMGTRITASYINKSTAKK
jgi:7-cyano-7-deazaguanine reductase